MNKQKALNIRVTNVGSIYLMLFTIFQILVQELNSLRDEIHLKK